MTAIPPTSSGTPTANTQLANSKSGSLGKDDFLKLFVAQLQHQDPSSPMDTDQSMQQMAAFAIAVLSAVRPAARPSMALPSTINMPSSRAAPS